MFRGCTTQILRKVLVKIDKKIHMNFLGLLQTLYKLLHQLENQSKSSWISFVIIFTPHNHDHLTFFYYSCLSRDLPEKIKHSSWVYKVWGGRVRSRVVCSRCNKPSDTFDWFLDLSLDVNKGKPHSISRMMNGFTREDKLEGDNKYHCDK